MRHMCPRGLSVDSDDILAGFTGVTETFLLVSEQRVSGALHKIRGCLLRIGRHFRKFQRFFGGFQRSFGGSGGSQVCFISDIISGSFRGFLTGFRSIAQAFFFKV